MLVIIVPERKIKLLIDSVFLASSQTAPQPQSSFDTHWQSTNINHKGLIGKMAGRNAKPSISTILRKNRGLWTV